MLPYEEEKLFWAVPGADPMGATNPTMFGYVAIVVFVPKYMVFGLKGLTDTV